MAFLLTMAFFFFLITIFKSSDKLKVFLNLLSQTLNTAPVECLLEIVDVHILDTVSLTRPAIVKVTVSLDGRSLY